MSIPSSLELSDQDQKEKQRLRNLGLQCISPGLSSGKMDERMLTAIQQSKHIARKQKETIQKMGSAQNTETEAEAGAEKDEELDQASDKSKEQGAGSSLKRSRVPPPLNIAQAGNAGVARIQASLRSSGAQSAPANVTQFARSSCRVKYLGRHPDDKKRVKLGTQSFLGAPFTPYALYHPPATAFPYQAGYVPNFYAPVHYPMVAPPGAARQLHQPSLQRDFESFMNKNHRVGTRDVFCNSSSRWAPLRNQPKSAREEFFGHRSREPINDDGDNDKSENLNNVEQDDNEDVEIAIEEGAEPTLMPTASVAHSVSTSVMQGEIRLLHDSFAFEFPMLEGAVDKKMFMSICDKVWDDVQELAKEKGV